MKKALQTFAIAAGVFVLLIVAAIVIIPMVVDVNDYKDQIAGKVQEQTGRELIFDGDIHLSVFPWLGVEMGPIRMMSPQYLGGGEFMSLKNAVVKVEVWPMLKKRIIVDTVILDGLTVNLMKDEHGKENWQFETPGAEPGPTPGKPAPTQAPAEGEPLGLDELRVGGVKITDANISYANQQSGYDAAVKDLNVNVGALVLTDPKSPVPVQLSCSAISNTQKVQADISLATSVTLAQAKRIRLDGLELRIDASGEAIPKGKASLSLSGDIAADMEQQTAGVKSLQLSVLGIRLSGDVDVTDLSSQPIASGKIALAECNPKEIMQALGLQAPATKDDKALTSLALETTFEASPAHAKLPALTVNLDGNTLTGAASAKDFAKPDVSFNLMTPSIDLDRYMPPKSAGGEKETKTDDAKAEPQGVPEPVKEQLRKLVLDGRVQADLVKASGITLKDALVAVTAKDGVLTLEPASTIMYGGQIKVTMKADLSGETTSSRTTLDVGGFQIGQFLQDLIGTDRFQGALDLAVDISGLGETWPAFRKTMDGTGSINIRDVKIRGFQLVPPEIEPLLQTDKQLAQLQKVAKEQNFEKILASFSIKDGLVSNNDLQMIGDLMTVVGKGNINLKGESIAYDMFARLPALPEIPIQLEGPLYMPMYAVNKEEFLKNLAMDKVKGSPEKTIKSIIENKPEETLKGLGEGLGGGLKNLFGD